MLLRLLESSINKIFQATFSTLPTKLTQLEKIASTGYLLIAIHSAGKSRN